MLEPMISPITGEYPESPVEYFVPLSPFERRLLSDLRALLGQSSAAFDLKYARIPSIFEKWRWSSLVKRCLSDDLGEESLLTDYGGNRGTAYNSFIHFLAHQGEQEQSLARAEGFRNANKDFLIKLGDKSIEAVEVKPSVEDLQLWDMMSGMYGTVGRYAKEKELLGSRDGTFDVLKLVRCFTISWEWPENRERVGKALIADHLFAETYEVKRGGQYNSNHTEAQLPPGRFGELLIEERTSPKDEASDFDIEQRRDKDGNISGAYLLHLLRSLGRDRPVQDPCSFIRFIPYIELSSASPELLQQRGISLQIPFIENGAIAEWVLWAPPYPGFAWNHHLHTEDEVYEYNMLHDWPFPDHYSGNQVIFAVREVSNTDFIPELRECWDSWNDCALSRKSADGPLLLLETIPGLRFRSRKKFQDSAVALEYFRNIVEAHVADSIDTRSVKDVIGLESVYTPLFENSLRIIPENQLNISWGDLIGTGANGAVFGAVWNRPPGRLATTRNRAQKLQVVLKDVIARDKTPHNSIKKLLEELGITYASLGGKAVGCVEFLGLTVIHEKDPSTIPSAQHGDKKLFLVFERATQGTVLGFLEKHLKDSSFINSWDQVISVLSSIGNGVTSLHKHNVLHRDLHLNNILVTDRYFPNDPQNPHEYSYLVADIGEGKVLSTSQEFPDPTRRRASYGSREFRAPEVRGRHGWSPKADVFSFGIIACKIFDLRYDVCRATPPEQILSRVQEGQDLVKYIIPAELMKAVRGCIEPEPDKRPTMREVVYTLDDLSTDFMRYSDRTKGRSGKDETMQWVHWEWNKDESKGKHRAAVEKREERGVSGGKKAAGKFAEFANIPALPVPRKRAS